MLTEIQPISRVSLENRSHSHSLGFGLETRQQSLTPSSNTGSKCQSGLVVAPDFIQGVIKLPTVEDFKALMGSYSDLYDDLITWHDETPSVHGVRFDASGLSARKAAFAYCPPSPERDYCYGWLSIPGSVIGSRGNDHFLTLCRLFCSFETFRATRFDVALDDYDKSIGYAELSSAVHERNYAGFRGGRNIESFNSKVRGGFGWTFYFGSPQSDKILRVYDKSVESGGDIDAHRWEAQFRAEYADAAFRAYVDSEGMPEFLASLVVGCISFIDRSSGDRLSRQSLLPWWSEFVSKVGSCIKFSIPRVKSTIQSKKDWITRQVTTTLAVLKRVYGSYFQHWLTERIEQGDGRLTPQLMNLARVAREDYVNRGVVFT